MSWTELTDAQKLKLGVSDKLYRFTNSFVNQKDIPSFVYAPTIEGSYYVKLDYSSWQRLLTNASSDYKYISVSFLNALRCSRIVQEHLQQKVDPSTIDTTSQQKQIEEEEKFIRTFREPWEDAFSQDKIARVMFPARAENGKADWVTCLDTLGNPNNVKKLKKEWQDELKLHFGRPSPGGSSKPPRYMAVPLVNPLVVCIEEAGRQRFDDAAKVFKTCIKVMEEDGRTYECKLHLGFPVDLKAYYRPLSTNPFGLYTTYIHRDDWHDYMNGLAAGGDPPIRQFIQTPTEKMETVNKTYAKRGAAIREIIGKFLKEAKIEEAKIEIEEAKIEIEEAKIEIEEAKIEIEETKIEEAKIGKYSDWPEATKKAIQRLDASTDHFNRYPDYILGRWGELSAAKIKNAVGKRDQEDDQRAVMGESAPVVAESIGWKWNKIPEKRDREMVNALFIGEWLHLSAFGWGGFLDFNSTDQGSTSQMPENLVLGTSETNSLMTRYEYAWQGLFRDEEALHKAVTGQANTVVGMLELYCNLPDIPIKYDVLDETGKYTWKLIDLREGARDVQQGPCLTYGKTTTANMRSIAKTYPWIAYSISYHVSMFNKSYILKRDLPSCRTVFYPFMRPFIHKAEDRLDKLLYAEMKKLAKAAMKAGTGNDVVFDDEKTE